MKKILLVCVLVFGVLLGLAGCAQPYENANVTFLRNDLVQDGTLVYELGSADSDQFFVDAKIENLSGSEVEFSSTNDCVSILSSSKVSDSTYRATIKANKRGSCEIVAKTLEGNKQAVLNVKINQRATDIESKITQEIAVLQGQSITLNWQSLLKTTPQIIDVNDFEFQIPQHHDGVNLLLEDGQSKLVVDQNASGTFAIQIFSQKLNKFVQFNITILPKLELTIEGLDDDNALKLFANDSQKNSKEIKLTLNTQEQIELKALCNGVENGALKFTPHTGIEHVNSNSQITYFVSFASEMQAGSAAVASFVANYKNYFMLCDDSEQDGAARLDFDVVYDSKIITISVNGSVDKDDITNISDYQDTIYVNTDANKRLKLEISSLPKNTTQTIVIKNVDGEGVDVFEFLEITSGGVQLNDGDQITTSANLVLSINNKTTKAVPPILKFELVSIYEDKPSAQTIVSLNVKQGIKDVKLVGIKNNDGGDPLAVDDDGCVYFSANDSGLNANECEHTLIFDVDINEPFSIDDFDLNIKNIVYKNCEIVNVEDKKQLLLTFASKNKNGEFCLGDGFVTLSAKNLSKTISINTKSVDVAADTADAIKLLLPNSQTNSDVALLKTNLKNGIDYEMHIKVGSCVSFDITPFGGFSNVTQVACESEFVVLPDKYFYNSEAGENNVEIVVSYFVIKNGKKYTTHDEGPLQKTFKIRLVTYYPIQVLSLSKSSLKLKSLSSVGYFASDLARDEVAVRAISNSSTMQADINECIYAIINNGSISQDSIFNNRDIYSLTITLKDANGDNVSIKSGDLLLSTSPTSGIIDIVAKTSNVKKIVIAFKQYDDVYSVVLRLKIEDVAMAEKVEISNASQVVVEGDYKYEISQVASNELNNYQLIAKAYPETAHNTKLVYEVFAQNGTLVASSLAETSTNQLGINISQDGRLEWKDKGLLGYIRITPQDRWQFINNKLDYVSGEHDEDVCLLIKLTIADGLSSETAFEVYSWNDILSYNESANDGEIEINKYLKLAKNIVLPAGFKTITTLNGEINGNGFEISNASKNLAQINNGCIKNLTIKTVGGAVCQTNNGKIQNLYIANAPEKEIINELNYGVCEQNYGEITSCVVDINSENSDFCAVCQLNVGTIDGIIYFGSGTCNGLVNDNALVNGNEGTIKNSMWLVAMDQEEPSTLVNGKEGIITNSGIYSYSSNKWILTESGDEGFSLTAPAAPTSISLTANDGRGEKFIKIDNSTVAIYLYQTNQSLSQAESAKLEFLNNYSLFTLATVDGESSFSSIYYSFSFNKNDVLSEGVLSEKAGRIVALGESGNEFVTMTIKNKLSGAEASLNIYVIKPIGGIQINKSTNNQDPTTLVSDQSTIRLKRQKYEPMFTSLLGGKIVLVQSPVEFAIDNLKISNAITPHQVMIDGVLKNYEEVEDDKIVENWQKINSNTALGLRTLMFEVAGIYSYNPFVDAAKIFGENTALTKAIKTVFERNISFDVYNGAIDIQTSSSEQSNEPYDKFEFEASITTDKPIGEDDCAITIKLFDEEKEEIVNIANLFNLKIIKKSQNPIATNSKFNKYVYEISLELKNKFSANGAIYYVLICANEDPVEIDGIEVKLEVLPQSLHSVSANHYQSGGYDKDNNGNYGITIKPDILETLAPGDSGILVINFSPYYSNVEKFEISNVCSLEGRELSFMPTVKSDNVFVTQTNQGLYKNEGGVLTIFAQDLQGNPSPIVYSKDGENNVTGAAVYIKTTTPSDVPQDLEYTITTKVFLKGQPNEPIEVETYLRAKYVPKATITYDGSEYDVAGRATWNNFEIEIINYDGDFDVFAVDDEGNSLSNTGDFSREVIIELDKTNVERYQITESVWRKVYRGRYYVGALYGLGDVDDIDESGWEECKFSLSVKTSGNINNQIVFSEETKPVYVQNAAIGAIAIKNHNSNVYYSYIHTRTQLEFDYVWSQPQTYSDYPSSQEREAVKKLEEILQKSINQKINKTLVFHANYDQTIEFNASTELSFDLFDFEYEYENGEIYVSGKQRGRMLCTLTAKIAGSQAPAKSFDFYVDVDYYTTEDKPILIKDYADFEQFIINNNSVSANKLDYILMTDIELENFTPIANSTNITSLDGNNKIITIKSFAAQTTTQQNYALFENVAENTTLKNLTINYQLNSKITTESAQTVQAAGLAITNQGLLTNCQIISLASTASTHGIHILAPDDCEVELAGFVVENEGRISSCRVGNKDNKFVRVDQVVANENITSLASIRTNVDLSEFSLSANGEVSGFVISNSQVISGSYFCGTITNNHPSDAISAGFVVTNSSSIDGCYVRSLSSGIVSLGRVAGFVYQNNADISNCYAKTSLSDMATSASGFVFANGEGGAISCCHSDCKMKSYHTNINYFCGVDDSNKIQNDGLIDKCYYYSSTESEFDNKAGAAHIKNLSANEKGELSDYERQYYGFCFTISDDVGDGVWISRAGETPDLVSANELHISARIASLEKDENNQPILMYLSGYAYGSQTNPIIIRNAQEFNKVFVKAVDSSSLQFYGSDWCSASFRIIGDLDMSEIDTTGEGNAQSITTSKITLCATENLLGKYVGGIVEGSGMTINNLNMASNETCYAYGLFAQLQSGALVRNFSIRVVDVVNTNARNVGALAGVVENSYVINISVQGITMPDANGENNNTNAFRDSSFIKGNHITGGVIGLAVGDTTISRLRSSINVQTSYSDNTNQINFYDGASDKTSLISYAGGVIGVVDISKKGIASDLYAYGNMFVSAYVVGGVSGHIGSNTTAVGLEFGIESGAGSCASLEVGVYNAQNDESGKSVGKGYVGGLVGELNGKLMQSRTFHTLGQDYGAAQQEIEKQVESYYAASKTKGTYEGLFAKGYAKAIGGLVGVVGGKNAQIQFSYSKNDIITNCATYIGGFVGHIKKGANLDVHNVYRFGNLKSDNAAIGLFVGCAEDGGAAGFSAVNSLTYFDRDYTGELPLFGNITNEDVKGIQNFTFDEVYAAHTQDCKSLDVVLQGPSCQVYAIKVIDVFTSTSFKDTIFNFNNGLWDKDYWTRNTILPELKRVADEEIVYIYESTFATDVYKIMNNPSAYFVLVADVGDDDNEFVIEKSKDFLALQKLSNIEFSGVLKGQEKNGAKLTLSIGIKTLNAPIFDSLVGADISGITFSGIKLEIASDQQNHAILCREAERARLENVTFSDCSVVYAEGNSSTLKNVAIAFATASSPLIKSVQFENCTIGKTDEPINTVTAGLLAGKTTGLLRIENLKINNREMFVKLQTGIDGIDIAYVGAAVGSAPYINYGSFGDGANPEGAGTAFTINNTNITVSGTCNEVRVGGAFGYAGSFVQNSNGNVEIENVSINKADFKVNSIRFGGFAGDIANLTVNDPTIKISFASDLFKDVKNVAYVGGIVGRALSLSLENVTSTKVTNTPASDSVTTFDTKNLDLLYFGTFAAYVVEDCHVEHSKTPKQEYSLKANTIKASDLIGHAGGECTIDGVESFGSITAGCDNASIGLLLGEFESAIETDENNLSMSSCKAYGNITISDANKYSTLYVGGLLGYSNNLTNISGCYVEGDITINSSLTKATVNDNIHIGGLVGRFEISEEGEPKHTHTVSGNTSFATIKNKYFQTPHIDALVGFGDENAEGENNYCPQLTLAVHDGALGAGITYSQLIGNTSLTNGSKTNPFKLSDKISSLESGKYYIVDQDLNLSDIIYQNGANIIGNGHKITLENGHIDNIGILSGIEFVLNYADITDINHGYIFGISAIGETHSNAICEENYGYIGFCTTDCELYNASPICNINYGIIESCHTAGASSNGFVSTNYGVIANSYTITHVPNGTIIAYNSGTIINFVYDQDCTEATMGVTGENITNIVNARPTCDNFQFKVWKSEGETALDKNYGYPTLNLPYDKTDYMCNDTTITIPDEVITYSRTENSTAVGSITTYFFYIRGNEYKYEIASNVIVLPNASSATVTKAELPAGYEWVEEGVPYIRKTEQKYYEIISMSVLDQLSSSNLKTGMLVRNITLANTRTYKNGLKSASEITLCAQDGVTVDITDSTGGLFQSIKYSTIDGINIVGDCNASNVEESYIEKITYYEHTNHSLGNNTESWVFNIGGNTYTVSYNKSNKTWDDDLPDTYACDTSGGYPVVYKTEQIAVSAAAGGLANSATGCTIQYCSFDGSLTGADIVGGIVGYATDCTIIGCTNGGAISSTDIAGGIVGCATNYCTFNGCTNNADISSTNTAGGIVGKIEEGATIVGCTNNGVIQNTGTIEGSCAGGIVGEVSANGQSVNITNCTNNGDIKQTFVSGGIVGRTEYVDYYWISEDVLNNHTEYTVKTDHISNPQKKTYYYEYNDKTQIICYEIPITDEVSLSYFLFGYPDDGVFKLMTGQSAMWLKDKDHTLYYEYERKGIAGGISDLKHYITYSSQSPDEYKFKEGKSGNMPTDIKEIWGAIFKWGAEEGSCDFVRGNAYIEWREFWALDGGGQWCYHVIQSASGEKTDPTTIRNKNSANIEVDGHDLHVYYSNDYMAFAEKIYNPTDKNVVIQKCTNNGNYVGKANESTSSYGDLVGVGYAASATDANGNKASGFLARDIFGPDLIK